MKLFYAPRACSIGIHYLLERLGLPYETQKLDIPAGDTKAGWFLALNPKAKVPVLQRDDGSVLTEFPVVAHYLAGLAPEAGLLPADAEGALRAAELTDFLVATVHMQGFSRIFRPARFNTDPAGHEAVQAQGREIVNDALAVVERTLAPGGALAGRETYADAALFYIMFWAIDRQNMTVPPTCAARYAALRSSSEAQRVFAAESIAA